MGNRGKARPRERRKEARPGEILAAALEVFAERGFAASRLDEVAARAGVSKGTLYLYYESKEALFKAVVRETVGSEIGRVERLIERDTGPRAALLAQILNQLTHFAARKEIGSIPKIVIAEAGNFPDLARFYLKNVVWRGMALIGRVLEEGIDRGEFRPVDVPQTAKILMAPVLFVAQWRASLEVHDTAPLDVEAFSRAHVDLTMAALSMEKGGSS